MKLIYCIADTFNPGGMERVLLNKLRWWSRQGGHELLVVTTDQRGRPPFYAFPSKVRMVDLGIDYKADNGRHPVGKILAYFRKRAKHKKALTRLLMQERADIVVSLYPSESSFIPQIRDGSKKVLELHFSKFFRLQYGRSGLLGLADRFRTWQDGRIVRQFDRFVVLTQEDAKFWGPLPNLSVIPNAVLKIPAAEYNPRSRRVIAVGRLDYQKGFDRLLDAWAKLPADLRGQWRLDIFGQGAWERSLKTQAARLHIDDSVEIHPPTNDIFREYAASAFLVMTSHYEGFPMVMVEAMTSGLPVVSFSFRCGPADIIQAPENGLTVPEGDTDTLALIMQLLMRDDDLRTRMSAQARRVSDIYSEETVMAQWEACFKDLLAR